MEKPLDSYENVYTITNMKTKVEKRGGAGRGQGRKPLDTESETVLVSIRMTVAQRAKLLRIGGSAWIRARIDKARDLLEGGES